MQLMTQLGAMLEISQQDLEDCLAAGNAFFDAKLFRANETPEDIKPMRLKKVVMPLRARQLSWNEQFGPSADRDQREKAFADVLEWGRGQALCAECNDIFEARFLSREEALIDGIFRRGFLCPRGHQIWSTPENMLGVISTGDYDFRPLQRDAPWIEPER